MRIFTRIKSVFKPDRPKAIHGSLQTGVRIPPAKDGAKARFLCACDCGNLVARTLEELQTPGLQKCNVCAKIEPMGFYNDIPYYNWCHLSLAKRLQKELAEELNTDREDAIRAEIKELETYLKSIGTDQ